MGTADLYRKPKRSSSDTFRTLLTEMSESWRQPMGALIEKLGPRAVEQELNSRLLSSCRDMQDSSIDPAVIVQIMRSVRGEIIDYIHGEAS